MVFLILLLIGQVVVSSIVVLPVLFGLYFQKKYEGLSKIPAPKMQWLQTNLLYYSLFLNGAFVVLVNKLNPFGIKNSLIEISQVRFSSWLEALILGVGGSLILLTIKIRIKYFKDA